MKLTLKENQQLSDITEQADSGQMSSDNTSQTGTSLSQTAPQPAPLASSLSSPKWYDVTRILYPLASPFEKPANFRLLIGSEIDNSNEIIL